MAVRIRELELRLKLQKQSDLDDLTKKVDQEAIRKAETLRREFENVAVDLKSIISAAEIRIKLDPLDNCGKSLAGLVREKANAALYRIESALEEV
jgi:biotin synthase-like enzyme